MLVSRSRKFLVFIYFQKLLLFAIFPPSADQGFFLLLACIFGNQRGPSCVSFLLNWRRLASSIRLYCITPSLSECACVCNLGCLNLVILSFQRSMLSLVADKRSGSIIKKIYISIALWEQIFNASSLFKIKGATKKNCLLYK